MRLCLRRRFPRLRRWVAARTRPMTRDRDRDHRGTAGTGTGGAGRLGGSDNPCPVVLVLVLVLVSEFELVAGRVLVGGGIVPAFFSSWDVGRLNSAPDDGFYCIFPRGISMRIYKKE